MLRVLGLIVELAVVKYLLIGPLVSQMTQDGPLHQSFTTTVVHYPYRTYPQHSIKHISNPLYTYPHLLRDTLHLSHHPFTDAISHLTNITLLFSFLDNDTVKGISPSF